MQIGIGFEIDKLEIIYILIDSIGTVDQLEESGCLNHPCWGFKSLRCYHFNKMNLKKVYIDYAQFGEKLKQLYHKIHRGGVPTTIIGIASGGLNLSSPLANWLKCKHIGISIHFYDGDRLAGKPYFASIPTFPTDVKNILLVDDILESGTTINYFEEQTKLVHGVNFKIATLHWNPNGRFGIKPDYYVDKKRDNTWIVYPWETEYSDKL